MNGFTHNCLAGLVGGVFFPRFAFLHRRGFSFFGAAVSWRDLKVEFLRRKNQPQQRNSVPGFPKKKVTVMALAMDDS